MGTRYAITIITAVRIKTLEDVLGTIWKELSLPDNIASCLIEKLVEISIQISACTLLTIGCRSTEICPPPPHFIVPSAGPALELCTVRSSIIAVLSVTNSLQWSLEVDMMDVGLGVSSIGAMPLDNSIHAAGFTCHS